MSVLFRLVLRAVGGMTVSTVTSAVRRSSSPPLHIGITFITLRIQFNNFGYQYVADPESFYSDPYYTFQFEMGIRLQIQIVIGLNVKILIL